MYLKPGTLLQGGKYEIVHYISSGGFGCTYVAKHRVFEKELVIKEFFIRDFCNREINTDYISVATKSKRTLVAKLQDKFIKEAQALFDIRHSNIVRVTDVFLENGTAYYAMDYIKGSSLADIIKKNGPLPEKEAMKYIFQIANALKHIHDLNRLHLDVKPDNIMIDRNSNAVLIDFGVSKQYDEENGENTSTLIGSTPGYAPLEQVGNNVSGFSPATDIYALGATIYKVLTGNTPPPSTSLASGDKLLQIPASIKPSICNAIEAAMHANKRKRPQDINDFLELLNRESITYSNTPGDKTDITSTETTCIDNSIEQYYAIDIISSPDNARVYIDGKGIGRSPLYNVKVSKGAHELILFKLGCQQNISTIDVNNTTNEFNIKFKKYSEIRNFHEGIAAVKMSGKWGFIDKAGKQVVPCKYNEVKDFSENLAAVRMFGEWGFINSDGKIVISNKYDSAESFSEGFAIVTKGENYALVDKSGYEIIPENCDFIWSFSNGLAMVQSNGKRGYIDTHGNNVIPCKYGECSSSFSEGYAVVMKRKFLFYIQYGYINTNGSEVIPFKFDLAGDFSEGMAKVLGDYDKIGYINKNGGKIIDCVYDWGQDFHEGLAAVKKNGKYGYINNQGHEVIPFQYENSGCFSDGLAWIYMNGKYGYIDKQGKEIVPCKYSHAQSFSEGLAAVMLDGCWIYIDKDGNEVY